MTDHPILMSAPMVRAILDARKSQTRRVITSANSLVDGGAPCMKRDPEIVGAWCNLDFNDAFVDPGPSPAGNAGPYLRVADAPNESRHRVYPRVQPGDRWWVRETWCDSMADGYVYRADLTPAQRAEEASVRRLVSDARRWKSSRYMPRRASRITLTVTSVRPERLQDISGEDSIAEGVEIPRCGCDACRMSSQMCPADASAAILEYAELWQHINGKRPGCAWADNPWVWVITFARDAQ